MLAIDVVDSHTAGEPTRVVVSGFPDLGAGSLAERRERFRRDYDLWRQALACEPRGSDTMVGALLLPPQDPAACTGVIFFNNVGYLGMCGHGTIGVVRTLAELGRIGPGRHRIETPVGTVGVELMADGRVAVDNVESWRHLHGIEVEVPGYGAVRGDVAWGGNWFFLIEKHGMKIAFENIDALTDFTWAVRQQLPKQKITGENGAEIDHIELFGPPQMPGANSKNFVLCPGRAYDRSPCGTGTSAKMACLYADKKLRAGETWRQESIVGGVFEGSVAERGGKLYPSITGSAFVNADSRLILDPHDPFCFGIRK